MTRWLTIFGYSSCPPWRRRRNCAPSAKKACTPPTSASASRAAGRPAAGLQAVQTLQRQARSVRALPGGPGARASRARSGPAGRDRPGAQTQGRLHAHHGGRKSALPPGRGTPRRWRCPCMSSRARCRCSRSPTPVIRPWCRLSRPTRTACSRWRCRQASTPWSPKSTGSST